MQEIERKEFQDYIENSILVGGAAKHCGLIKASEEEYNNQPKKKKKKETENVKPQ